jgi:hypothetical protein
MHLIYNMFIFVSWKFPLSGQTPQSTVSVGGAVAASFFLDKNVKSVKHLPGAQSIFNMVSP